MLTGGTCFEFPKMSLQKIFYDNFIATYLTGAKNCKSTQSLQTFWYFLPQFSKPGSTSSVIKRKDDEKTFISNKKGAK